MDACPSREKLRLWLHDQIDETESQLIEEHIEQCATRCQPYLDRLSLFDEANRSLAQKPTEPFLSAGTRVGDYEILAGLTRGGMGIIYKAWSTKLHRPVALKMLDCASLSLKSRLRFQREIETASRLTHANIINIHDSGKFEQIPYLVMEYADFGTLEDALGANSLEPKEAACLLELLARAVEFAHRQGVVHRDLKPQNVLLCALQADKPGAEPPAWAIVLRGQAVVPKIADFGLVKLAEEPQGAAAGLMLTSADDRLGTPSYMAPEQARGDAAIDGRTDVYSLGAIFYRLLTGRPPFQGKTRYETFDGVLRDDPKPPRQISAAIPRDLETICLKCLMKEPQNRYASPAALADDLKLFIEGKPIGARRPSVTQQIAKNIRSRPILATFVASTAFALLIVCVQAFDNVGQVDLEREKNARKDDELAANRQILDRFQHLRKLQEAQTAVDDGNLPEALQLLSAVPREERGWAWHHLRKSCDGCLFSLVGHEENVTQVEFTPDGTKIVSCSKDKTVRIWDARTGMEQQVLRGHTNRVLTLSVSPDSSLVASGDEDGTIRIWELRSGRQQLCLQGSGATVTRVAFSPDGNKLASGTRDSGAVRIWNVQNGRELLDFAGNHAEVTFVAFSPDGLLVVSGDRNGQIIVWEADTGQERLSIRLEGETIIRAGFTPNGSLWTCDRNGIDRLWDIKQRKQVETRQGLIPGNTFTGFTRSPDGAWLAAETSFGGIAVWDAPGKHELWKASGHPFLTAGINWLSFSPDGSLLASASIDKTIRVWGLHAGQRGGRLRIPAAPGSRMGIAFSPDGLRILAASQQGNTTIYSAKTGLPICELDNAGRPSAAVAYSPDGNQIATSSHQHIDLWDGLTGRKLAEQTVPDLAMAVAFSVDGAFVASIHGRRVHLWQPQSGKGEWLEGHKDQIGGLAFCPNSVEIVAAGRDGILRFWDYQTGRETRNVKLPLPRLGSVAYHPNRPDLAVVAGDSVLLCDPSSIRTPLELKGHANWVKSIAWLPHGDELASGSEDGSIRVWRPETGEMLIRIENNQSAVLGLTVNPSGDLLASGGADNSIRVWNASTELPVVEMEAHQVAVNCIALSDDGDRLASGGDNGTIRVWDTHTGDLLNTWQFDHPIMDMRFQNGLPTDCTNPAELLDPQVKKEAAVERRNRIIKSADGRVSGQFTTQLLRAFRQPSEQELAYRRWMTRPDPAWHVEQRAKFIKEGNLQAAHFHRVAEERAKAVVALDQGNAELAYWHSVAAAIIKISKP